MTSADEIRDVERATWAGLSAGWEKWDSVIMDQLGPVGAAIIERLDVAVVRRLNPAIEVDRVAAPVRPRSGRPAEDLPGCDLASYGLRSRR
jgi:hypothetical protein